MPSLVVCLLAGSFFFPGLFMLFGHITKNASFVKKRKTAASVVVTIAMRLTSTTQAVLAVLVGVTIVKETHRDVLYSRSELVDLYASFGIPYMIYDIGAMYLEHREERQLHDAPFRKVVFSYLSKQWVLVGHHIAIAFLGYPIVLFFRNGKGDFFVGCFFLTELSTPALNLRKILLKLEFLETCLFQSTNVLTIVTFFICRILIFPFMYWAYGANKRLSFYDTLTTMKLECHAGCALIASLQLMWFIMFVKSIARQWQRSRDDSHLGSNQTMEAVSFFEDEKEE